MDNEEKLKALLKSTLSSFGLDLEEKDLVIERSKDPSHGDYSNNAALKFSKRINKNPRDFALELAKSLEGDFIEKTEVAGPGFINFFLKKDAMTGVLSLIFEQKENYGKLPKKGKKVNVEYVSANPTGDLHLGHTRCAAVGESLATLLDWAGYDVTREYYVNDCGNQVEHLGHSLRARYHACFGEPLDLAEDDYHGEDLIGIAEKMKEEFGDAYLQDNQETHDFFIRYGIDKELEKLWGDLKLLGVHFDKVSYESDIRKSGAIEKTISELRDMGYVYEQGGATFLKTSAFLDDKDRPIIKSDGLYTYFAPDIAYHFDKLARGYDQLIDVLGSDHHGYIARLKSVLMMKGFDEKRLEANFVQVVRVYKDGEEVKMSKRSGKAIALRDLVEEVGKDAVRYFFVERSQSAHLDFNYNLALEQSSSNPVYYAQYAHARCASLLTLGKDIGIDMTGSKLKEEAEMSILKHLADFPSMIDSAAREQEPSKVVAYIHRLAELIHGFYAGNRIINRDDLETTKSRLGLMAACKIVMGNALGIIGVSAPEKM